MITDEIAGFVIYIALGVFVGWVLAHDVVANECEKLGSFYVGSHVYTCELKETK